MSFCSYTLDYNIYISTYLSSKWRRAVVPTHTPRGADCLAGSSSALTDLLSGIGGRCGIRTHGPFYGPTVFKTVPINQTLATFLKMAGVNGFEPLNDGIKTRCLTAWRYPNKLVAGAGIEPTSIRLMRPTSSTRTIPCDKLVRVEGLEPPTLPPQTECATRLRYTRINSQLM